jgi:hypothetical protein
MSTETKRGMKKKKKKKIEMYEHRNKERDERLEIEEMDKKIPGWKATSCSLGKTNKLQLRKTKHLKFEEDGLFDEEDWNNKKLEGFCGNLNKSVIPIGNEYLFLYFF